MCVYIRQKTCIGVGDQCWYYPFQGNLYSVVDTAEDFGLVLAEGLKRQGHDGRPFVKANIGE